MLIKYNSKLLETNVDEKLLQFINCRVLVDKKLEDKHLWVRNGIILNEADVFFIEKKVADIQINCEGNIICPGFIDSQINGGFGVDFSTYESTDQFYCENLKKVAKMLLQFGVTGFAPTIITSCSDLYKKVLPLLQPTNGSIDGAGIIGAHLEGPFISAEKKGCHPKHFVISSFGDDPESKVKEMFGDLKNIAMITVAPELEGAQKAIRYLVKNGVNVSIGHSSSNLENGEKAINNGAKMITHLFNAMQSYHHRDPGLIGLLTSDKIKDDKELFYGIISDGIHTHDSALRIAFRTNSNGMILVTDAIAALGMKDGVHRLGSQIIHVNGLKAILEGTTTTAGSVANMPFCIRHLIKTTNCSIEEALLCATQKPAKLFGINDKKGSLDVGKIADFVIIDEQIDVKATFCCGKRVYIKNVN